MDEKGVTVAIPMRWIVGFGVVGLALGFGSAFVVGPLVNWLLGLIGDAPGPLRLAATLPMEWAIPVLALLGLCLGVWVGREWRRENGETTVSAEGVTVRRGGAGHHVPRAQISGVFTDGYELILVSQSTNELLRTATDQILIGRLQQAFEGLGYLWQGTADPHENDFVTWIDGKGSLDDRAHLLLRVRQRARTDKQSGAADGARDDLRDLGIVVRDRDDAQQYRLASRR